MSSKTQQFSIITPKKLEFPDNFHVINMINGKSDFQIDFTNLGIIGSKLESKKYSKLGKNLGYKTCPKGTELILGGMRILYQKKPILIKTDKFYSRFSVFNLPNDDQIKFNLDINGRQCEYTDSLIQFETKLNLAILFKIIQAALNIENAKTDEDFIKQYKNIVDDKEDYQEILNIIHENRIIVKPHEKDSSIMDNEYAIDLTEGYKTVSVASKSILKKLATYLKKQKEDNMTSHARIFKYFLCNPKLDNCTKPLINAFSSQHVPLIDKETGNIKNAEGSIYTQLAVKVQIACKTNPNRDYFATRDTSEQVLTIEQMKLKARKTANNEPTSGYTSPLYEMMIVLNPTLEFKYGPTWTSIKTSWFVTQMGFKAKKASASSNPGVGLISSADFEDDDEPMIADNVIDEATDDVY